MSMFVGLQFSQKLACVAALSGYLPFHEKFSELISEANKDTPTFIAHGDVDRIVALEFGRRAMDTLESLSVPVEKHVYSRLAHSTNRREIDDLLSFLRKHLDF
eukprot:TRINITY_DN2553_c0_g2_i4.p1 TRINITY_DN2553_c0_g2~~TRINITY_DN2553_c0_g2_i4.p1  ORF type:complete len:103 (+),score=10.65 TRINITY_DN2553_c0_g2_i4:529-837(+)